MTGEALVVLVMLHGVDDKEIYFNPKWVLTVTEPHEDKEKRAVTDKAKCVVTFADKRFITVRESCSEVRAVLRRVP
jgi:hypothetical protein